MAKPSIFIGSSGEGRAVAHALRANLREDGEVTVWDQGVFEPGAGILQSLTAELRQTDFAILVFRSDDLVTSRTVSTPGPRDNVLFELGLFIGRLGSSRTYAVMSSADRLKIPSDLGGIVFATYTPREDGDLVRAVGSAADDIRSAILKATRDTRNHILSVMSGRVVYLLRHLEAVNQCRHENSFGKALARFECGCDAAEAPMPSSSDLVGWSQASAYACSFLAELGLVRYMSSGQVLITSLGLDMLQEPGAQKLFANAYQMPLVSL
jgi:Predicted nucleotide-binding protein containing TIR-like domain